jgi:hypothetical protein
VKVPPFCFEVVGADREIGGPGERRLRLTLEVGQAFSARRAFIAETKKCSCENVLSLSSFAFEPGSHEAADSAWRAQRNQRAGKRSLGTEEAALQVA